MRALLAEQDQMTSEAYLQFTATCPDDENGESTAGCRLVGFGRGAGTVRDTLAQQRRIRSGVSLESLRQHFKSAALCDGAAEQRSGPEP